MLSRITILCLLALVPNAVCEAIVLEAVTDVWIRESSADTTFEDDLMSVWNSFGNDAGTRRYGVVQFDVSSLSGIEISSAHLGLWGGGHGFSDQEKAIKQGAVAIDTTGGTPAGLMTWNIYQSEYAAGAQSLTGIGSYDLAEPTPTDRFFYSEATAPDRDLVEARASSGDQLLTLVLIADELDGIEYAHSWGDGQFGGERYPTAHQRTSARAAARHDSARDR